MEIKLNFAKEDIESILEKNGYDSDIVTMWYPRHPYNEEDALKLGEMCKLNKKIAYPKGMDCPWKHEEKPLLSKYKEFDYQEVVNKLISSILLKKLF